VGAALMRIQIFSTADEAKPHRMVVDGYSVELDLTGIRASAVNPSVLNSQPDPAHLVGELLWSEPRL
jgi:hypothetical protein